jgi:RND superfamily putative drug exporter
VAVIVALLILEALLFGAFKMDLGDPNAATSAAGTTGVVRQGFAALDSNGIGPGPLSPFEVLVRDADPDQVAAELATVEGVRGAVAPEGEDWRKDGLAIVAVVPEADGNSQAGHATLERVRDAAHELPGDVTVGGSTAADVDFIDAVYGKFPLMLALISVLTYVLLVRAFRSVLLPLKAIILNMISLGAAYGVMVLVWQEGYGSELLFGIEATHSITSWVPLLVFAFLYGLSMDYEVFILARVREEYDASGSTDDAVARGIGHTARLVTTAALILFLAFGSLASIPETDVKILATGLAAGILLDATIIRALLVPAAVSLMGRWNWWLPRWLERFAPAPRTAPARVSRTVSTAVEHAD